MKPEVKKKRKKKSKLHFKVFYFGKYGPEVLLFCERPCLTAVEARRRTLWDGKRRVCPSVSSSWQFLAAGQTARREPRSSCGPEDTRTSGTRERCGGLENGSGEVKKKKKKTAEERTVWMNGTKVSYSLHTGEAREKKVTKSGTGSSPCSSRVGQKSVCSVFVSLRRSFGHTPRTSGPPWSGSGFTFLLRVQETAPGVPRELTGRERVVTATRWDARTNFTGSVNSLNSRDWCAQRGDMWSCDWQAERGGVDIEGINNGARR